MERQRLARNGVKSGMVSAECRHWLVSRCHVSGGHECCHFPRTHPRGSHFGASSLQPHCSALITTAQHQSMQSIASFATRHTTVESSFQMQLRQELYRRSVKAKAVVLNGTANERGLIWRHNLSEQVEITSPARVIANRSNDPGALSQFFAAL